MANFATHIGVGTVVCGALATMTLAADVIAPENLIAVTLVGVLGSVLPDIDLKDSRASRAMFSGLAVFFSFCVLFTNAARFSIAELWLLWLGSFLLVRYAAEALFHRFSYHRGIWHSIVAGLFFWFLTAIVFYYVMNVHEGVAWLAGGFMFIGYMTHLILDEVYSVNILGQRLKRSFGSAMKLFDASKPSDSALIATLAVILFLLSPPSKPFVDGITSPQLWTGLQRRLLPEDQWFGVLGKDGVLVGGARKDEASERLSTGSIKAP
ncbi:MAG: metal-dependent hydrolase [Alphaproteobacteria bacterium]|nr:metal-dependent hydrolase [Alphaproteobacteria bacterium]